MENLKDKKLALFFTCGVSLKIWEKIGNLEREIKPYNELAKYFKKIYFITYGNKKEFNFQEKLSTNIRILSKPAFFPSRIYQFFIPLIYYKELRGADVYKTNQMAAVIPAILSKWLYKKKLIIRCGYEWLEFLRKEKKPFWKKALVFNIEKLAYKNADRIILTSEKDKRFVKNNFKVPFFKIEFIPNYIDTELFKPLKIEKDKSKVIFIGRLHEQKNLFNLIEAISGNSCKLAIIGSGCLKEKIKVVARKKRANIEFRENIPNNKLPEELNRSEIFILPSLYEGCPKTLLEAMSCGLPCIGTNVEGIKEIIRHRENGYLCDISVESIKKAIVEVLKDKELQEKIGKNARQDILKNFDFLKIMEKEINIYGTL
ncbi:glycosyltransferase family 4 protein [Patescibacteria group bacterium]|nr:glycosyltransferase family 4 protein [Patescibacteria group bacterium]